MKKLDINTIGETIDGRIVVANLFFLYDTLGMPLADVIDRLIDADIQPCWTSFYRDAKNAGWKDKTILSRLEEGILDTYGTDYWEQVQLRFELNIT